MRGLLFTVVWFLAVAGVRAQGPLINEVVPGGGALPDWIEVYNPGPKAVELQGFTLVSTGRTHRITAPLTIAAKSFSVLWCDRQPDRGPDHLDLKLPREGGSLLLIDPDRRTVRDFYSWRSLPAGVSLGRLTDGGAEWGFFTAPTPGGSNQRSQGATRWLPAPEPVITDGVLTCAAPENGTIRWTTDGRTPDTRSPELVGTLTIAPPCVITLRAFGEDALPSAPVSFTFPSEGHGPFVAIVVDPDSLNDPRRGILAPEHANYARTGIDWRRDALVEWHTNDSVCHEAVRIAVHGSGTRGLAKKSFKLFGDGEMILRADASPHAFLRHLFIESVARDAEVDVQPGSPMPLWLNGAYHGLYRAMPAKNSDWLRSLSGAEAIDLIDGPGARALKGDDDGHARLLNLLERGAPLEELDGLMDETSLLDLACFDLWTGRADHDLNTRCWRPRERGGRWRWILFDVDLWSPPDEGTVERMCSAIAPESPYLPWLLRHEELGPHLLARLSAWMATSLAPDRAIRLADSLFAANAEPMRADHIRWRDATGIPSPKESIAALRAHISARPEHLIGQLERYTRHRAREVTVRVSPPDAGEVLISTLPLTRDERTFTAFAGAPVQLTAIPAPGRVFAGWKGIAATSPMIQVDPAKVKGIHALFRLATEEMP